MKFVALVFILGIGLGAFLAPLHPMTTLAVIGVIIIACACTVKRERIRLWLVLSLFAVAGSLRSACEMQRIEHKVKAKTECLQSFRQELSEVIDSFNLSPDNMPVVKAMAIGEKSGIAKKERQLYSHTGASHILALSGMHLAIIYAILSIVFMRLAVYLYYSVNLLYKWYGLNPFMKFLLMRRFGVIRLRHFVTLFILFLIWLYVIMVGMSSSAVRSALMLTVYGLADMLFRRNNTANVLAFTALVMLMIYPLDLFDVGFQMSFLAVLGITVYYRPLHDMYLEWQKGMLHYINTFELPLYQNIMWKVADFIVGCVLLSFSAQMMVAPLVAYYFHVVSLSSLLTATFVSLSAFLIVTLSLAFLAVGLLLSLKVAVFLSPVLDVVVSALHSVLLWQSSLPLSYLDDVYISLPQLILVYLVIFCLTGVWRVKSK